MKYGLVLLLCALAAAAPSEKAVQPSLASFQNDLVRVEERNILINALIRQLISYVRYVINNGSVIFGLPPLDPLVLDTLKVNLPLGLINLNLDLKGVRAIGLGAFDVKTSRLDLSAMTFDVEIVFPKLDISAEGYDFTGDIYTAIPLYGKGTAKFEIENFVLSAKLFLKQSEDGRSILIERIENASYLVPSFKSALTGVIGGGNIDAVVNAIVEDVLIGYVNRFQTAIASLTSEFVIKFGNPLLDGLDTWRFIAPFVPRPRP